MKTSKRYSKQEQNVITNAVKNNPANLENAFRIAASQLPGRNAHGISQKWYNTLRSQTKAFTTSSSKKDFVNTKNVFSTKANQTVLQITDGKLDLGNGKTISGNFTLHL